MKKTILTVAMIIGMIATVFGQDIFDRHAMYLMVNNEEVFSEIHLMAQNKYPDNYALFYDTVNRQSKAWMNLYKETTKKSFNEVLMEEAMSLFYDEEMNTTDYQKALKKYKELNRKKE